MNFAFWQENLKDLEIHFKGLNMSIKKIALGFALAGIVGASSMLAENEGSFVGVQIGSSSVDMSYKLKATNGGTPYMSYSGSGEGKSGSRFGAIYGRYFAIDEDMGYRAYGFADLGDSLYNFNGNMDFLYTFVKFEKVEIRGFVGAYVGAVFATDLNTGYAWEGDEMKDFFWGIDAGLNVGARFVIAERHGIDLFYRYGFLSPETEIERDSAYYDGVKATTTWKIQQNFAGVRYTFSF